MTHRVVRNQGARNEGFTLVELLLVIVIIAILATVSVAAYANFQERANTAKAASIVTQYTKIFELYKFETGRYPTPYDAGTGVSGMGFCLGPSDKYPADDTFEDGQCANWTSYSSSHFAREGFNDLLKPLVSEVLPGDVSTVRVEVDGGWENYRGVIYQASYPGDNGYIHYFLKGTQTCPKGDTYHYGGATECVVSLDGVSPSEDVSGWHGGEGWWI